MQQKHVKLNDKLANEIKRIHDSRENRCRRKQTMSDTLRLLLYIGINQYNSESGSKKIRDAERQQAREERQQKTKDKTDEDKRKDDNANHLIKLI